MKRLAILFCLLLPLAAQAAPKSKLIDPHWDQDSVGAMIVDHSDWASFLSRYHQVGEDGVARVAYGAVTPEDRALLDGYISYLAGLPITNQMKAEQMAYWLNLYNALTVQLILTHYPVDSIMDIGGFFSIGPWGKKIITVEGRRLSLDDIEHGILRPIWNDARIHYAVNCASIGCPDLRAEPYTSQNLETQLEDQARTFINHPRAARVDEKGRLILSRLYKWYNVDFVDWTLSTPEPREIFGVFEHLDRYADDKTRALLKERTKIDGHAYDWDLNDATGDTGSVR